MVDKVYLMVNNGIMGNFMGVIHHCALRWLIMGYSDLLGYLMVSNELVGNLMGTYAPVISSMVCHV